MPEEYTNRELGIMIKNLCDKYEEIYKNLSVVIDDGFKGIHKRQDITNGKVITNTEWRLKAEGSLTTIKWIVAVIGATTILNVVVNVFK